MPQYKKDRKRVETQMRKIGVVVVMNKKHVQTPEHMVTTMVELNRAGFIAECTFRIDQAIINEAMAELTKIRAESTSGEPFILGVGSIINPKELDAAIEMGFDMIVAPGNVMGGYGQGKDLIKLCQQADVFSAPAIFTPTELNYFIERDDGLEPDAVKIFPANTHGDSGIKGLLAPYVRDRHANRIIMPTGGVNCETGPKYQAAIAANGFTPVLGMSAPLALVEKTGNPGNPETIKQSLKDFTDNFKPHEPA